MTSPLTSPTSNGSNYSPHVGLRFTPRETKASPAVPTPISMSAMSSTGAFERGDTKSVSSAASTFAISSESPNSDSEDEGLASCSSVGNSRTERVRPSTSKREGGSEGWEILPSGIWYKRDFYLRHSPRKIASDVHVHHLLRSLQDVQLEETMSRALIEELQLSVRKFIEQSSRHALHLLRRQQEYSVSEQSQWEQHREDVAQLSRLRDALQTEKERREEAERRNAEVEQLMRLQQEQFVVDRNRQIQLLALLLQEEEVSCRKLVMNLEWEVRLILRSAEWRDRDKLAIGETTKSSNSNSKAHIKELTAQLDHSKKFMDHLQQQVSRHEHKAEEASKAAQNEKSKNQELQRQLDILRDKLQTVLTYTIAAGGAGQNVVAMEFDDSTRSIMFDKLQTVANSKGGSDSTEDIVCACLQELHKQRQEMYRLIKLEKQNTEEAWSEAMRNIEEVEQEVRQSLITLETEQRVIMLNCAVLLTTREKETNQHQLYDYVGNTFASAHENRYPSPKHENSLLSMSTISGRSSGGRTESEDGRWMHDKVGEREHLSTSIYDYNSKEDKWRRNASSRFVREIRSPSPPMLPSLSRSISTGVNTRTSTPGCAATTQSHSASGTPVPPTTLMPPPPVPHQPTTSSCSYRSSTTNTPPATYPHQILPPSPTNGVRTPSPVHGFSVNIGPGSQSQRYISPPSKHAPPNEEPTQHRSATPVRSTSATPPNSIFNLKSITELSNFDMSVSNGITSEQMAKLTSVVKSQIDALLQSHETTNSNTHSTNSNNNALSGRTSAGLGSERTQADSPGLDWVPASMYNNQQPPSTATATTAIMGGVTTMTTAATNSRQPSPLPIRAPSPVSSSPRVEPTNGDSPVFQQSRPSRLPPAPQRRSRHSFTASSMVRSSVLPPSANTDFGKRGESTSPPKERAPPTTHTIPSTSTTTTTESLLNGTPPPITANLLSRNTPPPQHNTVVPNQLSKKSSTPTNVLPTNSTTTSLFGSLSSTNTATTGLGNFVGWNTATTTNLNNSTSGLSLSSGGGGGSHSMQHQHTTQPQTAQQQQQGGHYSHHLQVGSNNNSSTNLGGNTTTLGSTNNNLLPQHQHTRSRSYTPTCNTPSSYSGRNNNSNLTSSMYSSRGNSANNSRNASPHPPVADSEAGLSGDLSQANLRFLPPPRCAQQQTGTSFVSLHTPFSSSLKTSTSFLGGESILPPSCLRSSQSFEGNVPVGGPPNNNTGSVGTSSKNDTQAGSGVVGGSLAIQELKSLYNRWLFKQGEKN